MNVAELDIGQKARIQHIAAHGELGRRIRDMGLVSGTDIEVIGRAPLNDPIALRLPGFTISLRRSEAEHVHVVLAEINKAAACDH